MHLIHPGLLARTWLAEKSAAPSTPTPAPPAPPPAVDSFGLAPRGPARAPLFTAPPPQSAPVSAEQARLRDEVRQRQQQAHVQHKTGDKPAPSQIKVSKNGSGNTEIAAGDGDDKIYVRPLDGGKLEVEVNGEKKVLSRAQVEKGIIIRANGGNDTVVVDPKVKASIGIDGGKGDDTITGGAGDDRIFGGEGNDTIDGGAGDDHIGGGDGKDLISGGEGDDLLAGGSGDDTILGEAGHDKLYGGEGNDTMSGGEGEDYLQGDAGRDWMDGGSGRDTMYGGADRDTLRGGEGDDYLDGGKGNDLLMGDDGNDKLMGGRGEDRLIGGEGRDVLAGGYDKDELDGGDGKDKLYYQKDDDLKGSGDDRQEVDLSGDGYTKIKDEKIYANSKDQEWNDRVDDDLDTLRALPSGRKLIARLEKAQKSDGGTLIEPSAPDDDHSTSYKGARVGSVHIDPASTRWGSAKQPWEHAPNIIGLYHELVHQLQGAEGTLSDRRTKVWSDSEKKWKRVDNDELAAVGLPRDHDGKPSTPNQGPGVDDVYENLIREDLEYEKRTEY